jgi:hypothetical protein
LETRLSFSDEQTYDRVRVGLSDQIIAYRPYLVDIETPKNEQLFLNVLRLTHSGKIKWRVKAESPSLPVAYFVGVFKKYDGYTLIDWNGNYYRLNVRTGLAIPTGEWAK